MEPILDTSDLAAIAALPEPEPRVDAPTLADGVSGDPVRQARYREEQQLEREDQWVREARVLAAAGVRPGPSHRVIGDGELYPTFWGAFADVDDVAAAEVAAGRKVHGLPLVVFGVEVKPSDIKLPHLPDGYPWMAVAAQTAGIACHHRHLVGVVLEVRPEQLNAVALLGDFAHRRGHGCVGVGQVGLSTLADYAELVAELGLSAEGAYQGLEEACSPLDVSCAAILSDTPAPTDWEERWPVDPDASPLEKLSSMGPLFGGDPWAVWVLGENCD